MNGLITRVVNSNATTGAGTLIEMRDDNGNIHKFMHLQYHSIKVQREEIVSIGTVIGLVGNTGGSTGAHLHYEIRTPNNLVIDPLVYNADLKEKARLKRGSFEDYRKEWEVYKNSAIGSNLSTK
jgi:murein DD-endopeptidase MepM/ murein hydrolase activator NlpD